MNNELEIILESILEKVKKESASLNTNQKKILIYKSLYESLTNRQDLLEDKDETLEPDTKTNLQPENKDNENLENKESEVESIPQSSIQSEQSNKDLETPSEELNSEPSIQPENLTNDLSKQEEKKVQIKTTRDNTLYKNYEDSFKNKYEAKLKVSNNKITISGINKELLEKLLELLCK